MVSSLFQYRGFIWRNALHAFRHRYAAAQLGAFWNVIHPIAMIAIYAVVFTSIMSPRLPGDASRFSYIIYLCAGIIPWTAFAEIVNRGCGAFIANAGYLKKLPIPEPVFVAQETVASLITVLISFGLLLIFAIAVGMSPSVRWLAIPVVLAAMLSLGFSLGVLLGTLNVFFRDIQEWVGIALQAIMWTVPIVYVADILPAGYRSILAWHPLMPSLSAVRDLFVYGHWPAAWQWIGMWAWPVVIGAVAGLTLRALRDEIRDVI